MSTPGRRRPTLLVVGCGDVGLRVLHLVRANWRVIALTSSPARAPSLREAGAIPLVGDLDDPATLRRLAGLADAVLHLAPPPSAGRTDPRTAALLRALASRGTPRVLVYASTTGVYGDVGGARIDETRPVAPRSDRARRRADAEARVRAWGRATGVRVTLLRIPGIYAANREDGRPGARLDRGTPLLVAEDDAWTNHVHADDLARACVAALMRGKPQRAVNVCDDGDRKTGDHHDAIADALGRPRLPRVTRAQAREQGLYSPAQWSFLEESRRLSNARMKRELRVRLRYPTVETSLRR